MRSSEDIRGHALAWAAENGREQLELWRRPEWRLAQERAPEGPTEGEIETDRGLDPFQLSLGVFGAAR